MLGFVPIKRAIKHNSKYQKRQTPAVRRHRESIEAESEIKISVGLQGQRNEKIDSRVADNRIVVSSTELASRTWLWSRRALRAEPPIWTW